MKLGQRLLSGTVKRWKQSRDDCVWADALVRPASRASVRAKVAGRARTSRFLGSAYGMTTPLDWESRGEHE